MGHSEYDPAVKDRRPWNAGRKQGAKRALKPQQVWAIRFWPDRERRLRDRALFDLAIDSKLRGCDVVKVRIGDLVSGQIEFLDRGVEEFFAAKSNRAFAPIIAVQPIVAASRERSFGPGVRSIAAQAFLWSPIPRGHKSATRMRGHP